MAKMVFCDIEIKQRYMIAHSFDSPRSTGVPLFPTSCYYHQFIVFRLPPRISSQKRNLKPILLAFQLYQDI